MDKNNPTSATNMVDDARSTGLEDLWQAILDMGDQLQVQTAISALDDYETFLGIPHDSTLTNDERRVRIITKLSGQPATLANIKRIAKQITGIDVTIYEYGVPGDLYYDPTSHPWKVKIVVDKNIEGAKSFKKSYFEEIMIAIFPAHTEFEDDSFVYIPRYSYLSPVTGDHRPLVLGEEFLQFAV